MISHPLPNVAVHVVAGVVQPDNVGAMRFTDKFVNASAQGGGINISCFAYGETDAGQGRANDTAVAHSIWQRGGVVGTVTNDQRHAVAG